MKFAATSVSEWRATFGIGKPRERILYLLLPSHGLLYPGFFLHLQIMMVSAALPVKLCEPLIQLRFTARRSDIRPHRLHQVTRR